MPVVVCALAAQSLRPPITAPAATNSDLARAAAVTGGIFVHPAGRLLRRGADRVGFLGVAVCWVVTSRLTWGGPTLQLRALAGLVLCQVIRTRNTAHDVIEHGLGGSAAFVRVAGAHLGHQPGEERFLEERSGGRRRGWPIGSGNLVKASTMRGSRSVNSAPWREKKRLPALSLMTWKRKLFHFG